MYSDTPEGGDPDAQSPTLRRYHKLLWSKPLPSGRLLQLDDSGPKPYLYYKSGSGEFRLSSDAITHSYKNTKRLAHIIGQISNAEVDEFYFAASTIGGYILFPSNRVKGVMTINGARGCNYKICDRFDLTLECIRRHYLGKDSPLAPTLRQYTSFFDLFDNFRGYVDFFLLNDLVTGDYNSVRFYMSFNDFEAWPLPNSVAAYRSYRDDVLEFVTARNQRIENSLSRFGE